MLGFFFLVMLVNKIFRSEISYLQKTQTYFNQVIKTFGEEAVFGIGVIFVLIFSTISEALGFHFIIGAFFGGLLLNKDVIGTNFFESLTRTLKSITGHFLTPIFFAYLGLLINLDAFENVIFVVSLLTVGYATKILASWIAVRFSGFSNQEAFKMGLILNSRGTFDLIVAELALVKGYIDTKIFSILILFGVLSVIFNPVLYRQIYRESRKKHLSSSPGEDIQNHKL